MVPGRVCRWEQEPGQDRRVAVCLPLIGTLAARDDAGGVGKNEVVNIGVFDWRVGVLPETVEKEDQAEEGGREVKGKRAVEEGGEERGSRGGCW